MNLSNIFDLSFFQALIKPNSLIYHIDHLYDKQSIERDEGYKSNSLIYHIDHLYDKQSIERDEGYIDEDDLNLGKCIEAIDGKQIKTQILLVIYVLKLVV
jgi:hypothetical protein